MRFDANKPARYGDSSSDSENSGYEVNSDDSVDSDDSDHHMAYGYGMGKKKNKKEKLKRPGESDYACPMCKADPRTPACVPQPILDRQTLKAKAGYMCCGRVVE